MVSWAAEFLGKSRVARLATATKSGIPYAVPICFVYDEQRIYVPIDRKPKRVNPTQLKRVLNIAENPHVAVIVDHYADRDWKKLRYVMVLGTANIIRPGAEHRRVVTLLKRKYSQYPKMLTSLTPIIRILPTKVVAWRADEDQA